MIIKFLRLGEGDRPERLLLWLLLLAFAGLVIRGQGVLPSVMADEWHYSLLARLLPFTQSDDPGYAYLGLYGLSSTCANGYLGCVRILNALFFVGGCFLVFRTARCFLPPVAALGVVVVTLLAPESVYTLFFMPETMYFFLFWVFAFVALRGASHGNYSGKTIVLLGVILALISLVKPHGVFLVGCFCLYLIVYRGNSRDRVFGRRILLALGLVVTFLAVKLTLGFLAAGQRGAAIFGSRYSDMASQNMTIERIADLISVTAQILANHLSLVAFVFFLPLCGALSLVFSPEKENERFGVRNLALFALVVLLPLLGITAVFSASVAGTNPYDVVERMHMRYYSFSLPLLIILAGVLAAGDERTMVSLNKWVPALCLPLLILGVLHVGGWRPVLQINWIDSPGLMFIVSERWIRFGLMAAGVGVAMLALFRQRSAARYYLLFFLPVLFLADTYAIQKTVEDRKRMDAYDVAGSVVSAMLVGREGEQVTLFGPDEALLYKTSFYLDRANTAIRISEPGQSVDAALVPPDATQVIVFGGGHLNMPGFKLIIDQQFKLFSSRNRHIGDY